MSSYVANFSPPSAACRNGATDIYPRPLRLVLRPPRRRQGRRHARRGAVCRHLQPLFRAGKSRCRGEVLAAGGYRVHRGAGCRRRRASAVLRPHVPRPSARSHEASREMERTLAALTPYLRARHAGDRAGAELPARLPRRNAGADAKATPPRRWRSRRCCSRNFSRAKQKEGRLDLPLGRCRKRRCCTAIAIRRRSTSWARSKAC